MYIKAIKIELFYDVSMCGPALPGLPPVWVSAFLIELLTNDQISLLAFTWAKLIDMYAL